MNPITLTEGDLRQHVVQIGLDVFPPIEVSKERTHLNTFAEEAIQKWPQWFERLVSGTEEFRISRTLPKTAGKPGSSVETLTLTPRGPVFTFPIAILDPTGQTIFRSDEEQYRKDFEEVRQMFFSCIPGRAIMRLGAVRHLMFMTGKSPCLEALTSRASFAGASLAEGNVSLVFRDDQCNVLLQIRPMQVMEVARLPIGPMFQKPLGHGVQINLDVHNLQVRPLDDDAMTAILDRADSLWPETLLEYLAGEEEP